MKDWKRFPETLNRRLIAIGLLPSLRFLREQAVFYGLLNLFLLFDWVCRALEEWIAAHPAQAGPIGVLALAPSGSYLAYGWGSQIHLLSLLTLTTTTYAGHGGLVTALAWSPDGIRIASASQDGTVQVWEFATGRPLFTYTRHRCPVLSVAWSPEGNRLASAGADGSLHIWSADGSGVVVGSVGQPGGAATSLSWSPDGTCLLAGGLDGTVYLWDPDEGTALDTYEAHQQPVSTVAWCPDARRFLFATAGYDGYVKIWSAERRDCLFMHMGHNGPLGVGVTGVVACAWSADGKRVISAGVRGVVQEWLPPLDEGQAFVVISIPTTAFTLQRTTPCVHSMATGALRWQKDAPATLLALAGDGWMYIGPSPADPAAMLEDTAGGRMQPFTAREVRRTERSS